MGGSLLGPISMEDLNDPKNLPTILSRLIIAIQEQSKFQGESSKQIGLLNETIISHGETLNELKTTWGRLVWVVEHPWQVGVMVFVIFMVGDYLSRYSYWGIWPK